MTIQEDYLEIPHGCILGVKTIIVNGNSEILVIKRSNDGVRPGGWDFAGGLVELGENPENAALREAKEETGLDVKDLHILGTTSDVRELDDGRIKHTVMLGYRANLVTNSDVQLSQEHTEYKWLEKNEVENLDWPEQHRHFLSLL